MRICCVSSLARVDFQVRNLSLLDLQFYKVLIGDRPKSRLSGTFGNSIEPKAAHAKHKNSVSVDERKRFFSRFLTRLYS